MRVHELMRVQVQGLVRMPMRMPGTGSGADAEGAGEFREPGF